MSTILDLRNKRANLWEQTKAFLEEHRDANGLVAADAVETYNRMVADVQALGTEIERMENQMQLDAQLSKPTSEPIRPAFQPAINAKPTATDAYNKAFWQMVRGNVTPEVRNALSVGTDAKGGYTVPDEFERQLIQALEENNIFRQIAHVIKTESGTHAIPVASDSGEAVWVDEGGEITDADPTFAQAVLKAYKMGTLVKVSNELLNDSAIDIAGYIAERIGKRFGNAEEKAFFTGTGESDNPAVASQPTGILTTLNGDITTDAYTAITFDDVYGLYYKLAEPYRKNARFICNETIMLKLMTLKDGESQYIWKPSLEIGKPDTILGRPVHTSQYMPALAGTTADKNKKVMLFGDFGYYWIGDRGSRTLKRLNELYAVTDQVGFIGTQRVDGKLILSDAVKCLKMAAA